MNHFEPMRLSPSPRMGYSPDFMESLGKCRECGGGADYPMLVTDYATCRAKFHSLRFRIASAIFKYITGMVPRQERKD